MGRRVGGNHLILEQSDYELSSVILRKTDPDRAQEWSGEAGGRWARIECHLSEREQVVLPVPS